MADLSGIEVSLESLERKSRHYAGTLAVEALLELGAEARVLDPVQATLTAAPDEGRYRVTGQLEGHVGLACARCLEDFALTLHVTVDRAYLPPGAEEEKSLGGELEMVDDAVPLREPGISLLRLVEEEMLLALPMVPLCRENCRGLCQGCGADLNQEACRCREEAPEGPFAVLKVFKQD